MNPILRWFYQWAVPHFVYPRIQTGLPWVALLASSLLLIGLVWGLVFAPADYQQGDAFRIIYVHVPAAWLSMLVYMAMTMMAISVLVWRIQVAELALIASAPIGAAFTLMALFTGAIWGKPMWGAWWVWDARLTSELILLFIYLGIFALYHAIEDKRQAAKAASLMTLVGVVNIPIIHYSVIWWNTLHQPPSLSKLDTPSIHPDMLWPLLITLLAFKLMYVWMLMLRLRTELLLRYPQSAWVQALIQPTKDKSKDKAA
jgi:heme exporter protein C